MNATELWKNMPMTEVLAVPYLEKALEADRAHWRTLAEKAREALDSIVNGRFHIGNDDRGNIFGLPDGVMCRSISIKALALFDREAVPGRDGEKEKPLMPTKKCQCGKTGNYHWGDCKP